jgi:hypothetical protein
MPPAPPEVGIARPSDPRAAIERGKNHVVGLGSSARRLESSVGG